MLSNEIQQRIINVFANESGVDASKINAETALGEKERKDKPGSNCLGMDSLDAVEAVMALEEELGITIPDEEAQRLKTVQDAFDLAKRKLADM
jgi:acyl carrier protein